VFKYIYSCISRETVKMLWRVFFIANNSKH
jgi:hypothetical protein